MILVKETTTTSGMNQCMDPTKLALLSTLMAVIQNNSKKSFPHLNRRISGLVNNPVSINTASTITPK